MPVPAGLLTAKFGHETFPLRKEASLIMKSKLALSLVVAVGLWISIPAVAHHGDAGRYDETLVTLNGTVVELQMINPHSIIVLDVAEDGKTTRWQAEMGGPNNLARGFGWTRNTLKAGDKITLIGRRVKSGAPYMNLTERAIVYLTDSKRLLFRTGNSELPPGVVDTRPAGAQGGRGGAAAAPAAPAAPPAAAAPGGAAY
jgi:hypothetical protein